MPSFTFLLCYTIKQRFEWVSSDVVVVVECGTLRQPNVVHINTTLPIYYSMSYPSLILHSSIAYYYSHFAKRFLTQIIFARIFCTHRWIRCIWMNGIVDIVEMEIENILTSSAFFRDSYIDTKSISIWIIKLNFDHLTRFHQVRLWRYFASFSMNHHRSTAPRDC